MYCSKKSTSSTTIIEKKFVSSTMDINYLNFCGTSNEQSPIDDGRRVFITEANKKIYDLNGKDKLNFFAELNAILSKDSAPLLAKTLIELFIYYEKVDSKFRQWFKTGRYNETPTTLTRSNPMLHFWHQCLLKKINVSLTDSKTNLKKLYIPRQNALSTETVDINIFTWAIYVESEDLMQQYNNMQRGTKSEAIKEDSLFERNIMTYLVYTYPVMLNVYLQ